MERTFEFSHSNDLLRLQCPKWLFTWAALMAKLFLGGKTNLKIFTTSWRMVKINKIHVVNSETPFKRWGKQKNPVAVIWQKQDQKGQVCTDIQHSHKGSLFSESFSVWLIQKMFQITVLNIFSLVGYYSGHWLGPFFGWSKIEKIVLKASNLYLKWVQKRVYWKLRQWKVEDQSLSQI